MVLERVPEGFPERVPEQVPGKPKMVKNHQTLQFRAFWNKQNRPKAAKSF